MTVTSVSGKNTFQLTKLREGRVSIRIGKQMG